MAKEIDWESFIEEPENIPAYKSALGGVLQGATMGFADELAGAGRALMDPEAIRRQGLLESYKKQRDISRAKFAQEEQANPKSYLAGELGGSLATAPLTGAATLPKAMGLGAAYGLGKAEGSPLEQAGEAVTGAALGGVGEKVISAASPYIKQGLEKGAASLSTLGEKAKSAAEPWAMAAAGPMLKDWRKSDKFNQIHKIGRDLLDEGVVTPLASQETIALRAGQKAKEFGKSIDDTLKKIDELSGDKKAFEVQKLLDEINNVAEGLSSGVSDFSQTQSEFLKRKAKDIESKFLPNSERLSLRELEGLKRELAKDVKFDATNPQAKRDSAELLRKMVQGNVESEAKNLTNAANQPELMDQFLKAKQKFGSMKQAEATASDRALRNKANRYISPSDYAAGSTGSAVSAIGGSSLEKAGAIGFGLAMLNKIGRRFGSQTSAVTLDAVGNMLKSAPEKLGKYGPVFEQALQKGGPRSLNVLVSVGMKKDPELAQAIASELGVDVSAADKENAIDWEEFVKE